MPKFTMQTKFQLSRALKSMCMVSAFGETADFSGMSRSDALSISEVIHQAFVSVDELGTEAAAATAVTIGVMSALNPPEPVIVRADHPFLFLIHDDRTGVVLFIGRVKRPA